MEKPLGTHGAEPHSIGRVESRAYEGFTAHPAAHEPFVFCKRCEQVPHPPCQFSRTGLNVDEQTFISPDSFPGTQPPLSSRMPKQATKIRFDEIETAASDGYYVFLTLLCAVAATTCALLVSVGIEMLS